MLICRIIAVLFLVATLTGCSAGVYSSEFTCPTSYNGRCISLPTAYDLARSGKDMPPGHEEKNDDLPKVPIAGSDLPPVESAHLSYKESLFKKFDSLLQEPTTPVVAPPQVMRVLLLPYKGEANELYMLRYVYFFVDEPKWILGDSVVDIGEEE